MKSASKKIRTLLCACLLSAAVPSMLCADEDKPTHECTSWMIFPDVTGENTTILHKSRDSQSRDVIVRKDSNADGLVWLGMGGSKAYGLRNTKGFCMAVNSAGLAGVMNGGEKCTDNSKDPKATTTPQILEEIIQKCKTAKDAVKMLQDFLKKGDYYHKESGSIFFFADVREGYLVELTANFHAVQKCDTGYVIRANIWHHPGMEKYATTDYYTHAVESAREYVVRHALNTALKTGNKVTVADILNVSRETNTHNTMIRRSVCCSWTNSNSTFVIDRDYPGVLTTAYLCVGAPRHTVLLPVPICIKEIPAEMGSGKLSNASYKRLKAMGPRTDVPAEWLAFEKAALADYAKELAKAKELLKSNRKAEAVALVNTAFNNIWDKAKKLPGLL